MLTMCLCQRVRNLTPRVCVRGYEMLTHVCVSEGKKCYSTCVCQRVRNVTLRVCIRGLEMLPQECVFVRG